MKGWKLQLLFLVTSTYIFLTESYEPLKKCPESETVCRYTLTIEHKLTMMYNNTERVNPCNSGRLCFQNRTVLDRK